MGSLLAIAGCGVVPGTVSGAEPMFVYVGTYAPEDEPGIYIYRFDPATGALSEVGAVAGIRAPSFQALHPSGRFLYSVSESGDYAGQRAGAICAYAIDPQTGVVQTTNYDSYKVPGSMDMPESTVLIVDEPDPKGPFGAKGVGEPGMVGIAPAIANAIYDAVGVRMREVPITPEAILAALADQDRE